MKARNSKPKVNVITLGCSKNLVDSEVLLRQLNANGLQISHDSAAVKNDIVIINTCGFIKDSKEESIDTIMQYIRAKEEGLIRKLFVMGCLSERYKKDLINEIPEVDKYFGVNDIKSIIEAVGYDFKSNLTGERLLTTPSHYAYLKVSEGCDRQCSFCAIPLIRGKHHTKPIEELINEASYLKDHGVRELILIAQDLTYYGVDIYKKQALPELLEKLSDLNFDWIRLHYAYPAGFPKELLRVIRERQNICNYLDIPLQHISDPVLRAMRRNITKNQTIDLVNKIREEVPNITLRTTLLVGHPGEGDTEYEELEQFIIKSRFDRLGVFTYSEEENTWGAGHLNDIIPEEIKQLRAERIMSIQEKISLELNDAKVGQSLKAIIDRKEQDYWVGRTEADSPEVDNEILIKSSNILTLGSLYSVNVTGASEYDLYAEL